VIDDALLARLDARETAARLRLDGHQLWDLDDDEQDPYDAPAGR